MVEKKKEKKKKSENRSKYMKNYYEENKDDICAQRKERYHADPSHKKYILDNAKRRYLERREQEVERFGEGFVSGWLPVIAEIEIKGRLQERKLYRIGELVKAVDKSYATVERWCKKGYVPQTPYISRTGQRFFTEEMIDAVVEAFYMMQGENISKQNQVAFRAAIEAKWKKIGIPVD